MQCQFPIHGPQRTSVNVLSTFVIAYAFKGQLAKQSIVFYSQSEGGLKSRRGRSLGQARDCLYDNSVIRMADEQGRGTFGG
ncbi:MAG: hypothetical protein EZS28_053439, partial [Streblomastix strix]